MTQPRWRLSRQRWRRQRNTYSFKQVLEYLLIHQQQQQYPYLPIPLLMSLVHRLREHVSPWRDAHRLTATPLCHQWPAQSLKPEAHRSSL